jgi:hypothetical protein
MRFVEGNMKGSYDRFVLSTGREFYGFGNRLSLNGDGVLAYGHDGRVDDLDNPPLTLEEKREIADAMIARWIAWGGTGWTSYLSKASRFDVISPCEKYPDGVAIVRVGDLAESQWMIAGGARSLCKNGEWFRHGAADQGPTIFTLDEAFVAVEKLAR